MSKYIFVTGGVISSLGKGITVGSIGTLLSRRGLRVRLQKFDPYINVDPGTMNPQQHGEVYVTEDGAETDLDLGHYERFTGVPVTRDCNWTTGQIYQEVINKERRGDYLGGTVQVIPHITDEIKSCMRKLASDDVDVVITEIGGTVGDIESLPFIEAIRQMRADEGIENTLFIHLTLVPYIKAAGEVKTKPTQHSVGKLREIGIQPDILVCRSEVDLAEEHLRKIALFCNVNREAVFEEKDVEYSIYEVPLVLAEQGMDELICRRLGIDTDPPNMDDWLRVIDRIRNPESTVEIAIVGKYSLKDAYKSIYEAFDHAGVACRVKVRIRRVDAGQIEEDGPERVLEGVHGVLVPGGFGQRGVQGKIAAVRYARTREVPFLGLCLGMQCATIEFARNVLGFKSANSTEFEPETPHPVISLLSEQEGIKNLGGTMRLGAYKCLLEKGSKVRGAYGSDVCSERHRHRYEFNNCYRDAFDKAGMRFCGLSPDGQLVEIIELVDHPWFIATQAHPEFKSRPDAPHPLFRSFVRAVVDYGRAREIPHGADERARQPEKSASAD